MISSTTLFLATLALNVVAVMGAPISIPAEIAPRSLDNSGASVRFAREEIFPSPVPAVVTRAIVAAFPVVKRDTEDIVRRFPRRFIHEYLEKRGTTVTEKITVSEKVIKHDNPVDTVAYNNGQPHNGAAVNNGAGGLTTTIGFTATITVPGAPTPTTVTTTVTATVTPTGTPAGTPAGNTGATPGDATNPDGTTGSTTTPTDNTAKPVDNNTKPADGTTTTGDNTTTTTTPPAGTDPNATNGDDTKAKPADGTTTTTPPAATTTGTTTDGTDPATGADGNKPADGTTTSTDGNTNPTDNTNAAATRREVKAEASAQPIAKRQIASSGAAFASSLRRRAL